MVSPTYTYWTGAVSTNWNTAGNWNVGNTSPATTGVPPSTNAYISIPAGSTITGIPAGQTFQSIHYSGSGNVSLSGGTSGNPVLDYNQLAPASNINLILSGYFSAQNGLGGNANSSITLNGATVTATGGTSQGTFIFDHVSSGGTNNILNLGSSYKNLVLQGLGYGDQIQSGIASGTVTLTPNSGGSTYTLKVGTTTISSSVTLDTGAVSSDFTDTGGYIKYTGPAYCFLAGTRLATPDGEVAVEDITAGTILLTAAGEAKPVRWLGRSVISTLFADPLRAMPIRIAAGALGENLPARDLLVSPDHAMCIGGNLVQAGALVNGRTITRETEMPMTFTYYHVEMATHELVLAEGAPSETFVDNVDRFGFQNWEEHEALNGEAATIMEMDLPRVKSARQLPAATLLVLAARANALLGEDRAAA